MPKRSPSTRSDGNPPSTRFPLATGPIAGALAGALVGLADGARAAWLVGADGRSLVASALLAASADALLGTLGGGLVELTIRLALWGRRVPAPRAARMAAWSVVGGVVVLLLWKSRAPLHGRSLTVRSLRVAAVASLAPWLLARAARARFAIPAPAAIAIAVLVFVVPATAALATSWGDNLRFAPW